jgi:iron complex outermembrane receptor protein
MRVLNARRLRATTALTVAGFGIYLLMAPMASAEDGVHAFNIPPENTAKALSDFAGQAGIQILFPYDAAAKYNSAALQGAMTRDAALKQLLANTGLEIANQSDTEISLRVKESPSAAADEKATEVVVTGSHIRGGNPTSPVHTVTTKDIQESGYTDIGDVLRSLPENFSGGQNPGVIGATSGNTNNENLTGASTVNLRGLGSDATLLLVNGHRLSNDGQFQAADISGVPLGAVQRIEVVPDGASALYGSDAVAGVVNVILKKDYSGVEVNAVAGGGSEGAGTNRQASILAGFHTSNSYGLLNIEVQNQDPVNASDRARTADVAPETTLLPGLSRRSLFLTGGYDLSDAITVSTDILINQRDMQETLQLSPTSAEQQYSDATPAFSAAANLDAELGGDWKLHAVGLVSGGHTGFHIDYPTLDVRSYNFYANTLDSIEFTADGTLFDLPSGPVKGAFGAGTRHESFSNPTTYNQQVNYAFGEVSAPLFEPSPARTGLEELSVDASARTEHYSTFGSTTDPKIGLRYVPVTGLDLTADWGKSFKAPSFLQLYSTSYAYVVNASTIGYGSSGTVLTTLGGNPNLKPEKSTSWTVSAKYSPPSTKGLTFSATYFNIDYRDRVIQPASVIVGALSTDQYAPFVEVSPSAATQSQVIASANTFLNVSTGEYDPSKVVALFRNALVNASSQKEEGVDLGYRQIFHLKSVKLSTFADATLLKLQQRYIPTSPLLDISGTIFNVPKTKARAGVSFEQGGLSTTLIGNYVSSETDNGIVPSRKVGSWTTSDFTAVYAFGPGPQAGNKLGLSILNIFDRKPPMTYSSAIVYGGLNYDSTNASILGRYASLSVTKGW